MLIYADNLIQWATFRLRKVKNQRERRKPKAREGKDEKADKTLKHEKTPSEGGFRVGGKKKKIEILTLF